MYFPIVRVLFRVWMARFVHIVLLITEKIYDELTEEREAHYFSRKWKWFKEEIQHTNENNPESNRISCYSVHSTFIIDIFIPIDNTYCQLNFPIFWFSWILGIFVQLLLLKNVFSSIFILFFFVIFLSQRKWRKLTTVE